MWAKASSLKKGANVTVHDFTSIGKAVGDIVSDVIEKVGSVAVPTT